MCKIKKIISKLKQKTNSFDVFTQKIEITSALFENNKLKTTLNRIEQGFGLRLVKNKKIGFFASNDFENFDFAIDKALELSKFGEKSFIEFPEKAPEFEDLKIFSKKINEFNILEVGNEIVKKLQKIDKNLKVNADLKKFSVETNLINSSGLDLTEKRNNFVVITSVFEAEEKNFVEIWDYITYFENKNFENEINEMVSRIYFLYQNSKKIIDFKSGNYPVIFTPKAFATILELLLRSFDGTLIERKVSFFSDKINKKVFKIPVNLFDDPLKKYYPNSVNFDGDGVKPQKIFLIENGVVKNFFLDLQTAGKMKKKSNGHSFRHYSSLPRPNSTNLFFSISNKNYIMPEKKIFESIDKAVLVDQLLGAGQSNLLAGEFSVNVDLGFFIENGKIKGRIKNCMLAGNLFELLNNIEKISEKTLWYHNIQAPFALIKNLPLR